jgi:hypothetical protein
MYQIWNQLCLDLAALKYLCFTRKIYPYTNLPNFSLWSQMKLTLLLTDCVVDVSHLILSAIVLGQSLGSRLTKSQLKHVQTKCHVNSLSSNTTEMSVSVK